MTESDTTTQSSAAAEAAHRLRDTTAGVKVSISWLGVRKTLSPEQKSQAADVFGANEDFLSAAKKLLDTAHPAYRAVTAVRNRITNYWKALTLPFPEPGIRLIRQDRISAFDAQMREFQSELREAVAQLEDNYSEMRHAARQRLGDLYCDSDYPDTLTNLFDVEWSFPTVEPPEYLRQLNPELYRQECHRVAARFDEAVRMAEEAFLAELGKLVDHLLERLSGAEDGKPKIFRDSAVTNLLDFFDRFRALNVGSNQQLDDLVEQCRRAIRGQEPQQLRDQQSLRQHVATHLSAVQATIDGMMIDRPRRNILRSPR
jgi:hypothetical protein